MAKNRIVVVGSMNMDVVVKVSRFPVGGETILGDEIHFIPGGKGANQAVAAARLGADATMIGAVGTDGFGQTLVDSLTRNGVNTRYVLKTGGAATGTASITLAPDENQIVVVPGANAHMAKMEHAQLEEGIKAADIVLIQLEIPLETVELASDIAQRYGKPVILNPAPARPLSDSLLSRVHYITPNRSELETITGMDMSRHTLEEAADALLKRGVRCVVTTLGSEGAAWKEQGGQLEILPAYSVPVVDTTGAGDAFNAGLGYYLSKGYAIGEAVRAAMKVSALAVTKFGAQDGMPIMEEIEAFSAPVGSH